LLKDTIAMITRTTAAMTPATISAVKYQGGLVMCVISNRGGFNVPAGAALVYLR
jgi:hypothetical protein